jgi:hypothetical protein
MTLASLGPGLLRFRSLELCPQLPAQTISCSGPSGALAIRFLLSRAFDRVVFGPASLSPSGLPHNAALTSVAFFPSPYFCCSVPLPSQVSSSRPQDLDGPRRVLSPTGINHVRWLNPLRDPSVNATNHNSNYGCLTPGALPHRFFPRMPASLGPDVLRLLSQGLRPTSNLYPALATKPGHPWAFNILVSPFVNTRIACGSLSYSNSEMAFPDVFE